MWKVAHEVLERMRLPNGLYVASPAEAYRYVWIRDNCFVALAYQNDPTTRYEEIYHAMLDIFRRYLWKIDYHAKVRPQQVFEYIHPRYSAETLDELQEPWGNAQNDAIGAFLYGVGKGLELGKPMLRDEEDYLVVSRLAAYLARLEYWQDEDNGMWEENREVHASSIGACAAGLAAVQPYVPVQDEWISNGVKALISMHPRESASKACDLAQLSLVYPYQILPRHMMEAVVLQVEHTLLRDKGVIRYEGDLYYRDGEREAEWCFGLPWLGLAHETLGNLDKANQYLDRTERVTVAPGVVPELYLGAEGIPNPNTPLAWSVAMYMQLLERASKPAVS